LSLVYIYLPEVAGVNCLCQVEICGYRTSTLFYFLNMNRRSLCTCMCACTHTHRLGVIIWWPECKADIGVTCIKPKFIVSFYPGRVSVLA